MADNTIYEINKPKDTLFPIKGYDIGNTDGNYNDILECHWHEEWEFFTIIKGRAYFTVNGKRMLVFENDIIFVPGDSVHTVEPYKNEPFRYRTIVFDQSILCGQSGDIVQSKYLDPLAACKTVIYVPHKKSVYAIFAKIFEMITKYPPMYEIFVKAYLYELFASAMVVNQSHDTETSIYNELMNYDHCVKKCINYMHQTYAEHIYISELAQMMNMSTGYFIKVFKQLTSLSPIEYLICLRLAKAADALYETKKPVSHIAMDTGFNNLGYFTRAFQKRFGCTPTEYRKRNS